MVCQGYRRGSKRCTSHRVREDAVLSALGELLRTLAREIDPGELAARTLPRTGDETVHRRGELERALQACRRRTVHLYRDQEEGVITRTEFQELLLENRRRREELEARLGALPPAPRRDPDLCTADPPGRALPGGSGAGGGGKTSGDPVPLSDAGSRNCAEWIKRRSKNRETGGILNNQHTCIRDLFVLQCYRYRSS